MCNRFSALSFFATTECCILKALVSLVWHTVQTIMSNVFGMGQSTNSMALKLAKWAKFVLVLTNTHMLKKSGIFVKRISKVRWPTTVTAKELTSRQKQWPHGKKKNIMTKGKRFTRKRITTTSRQKKKKLKCPLGIEEILLGVFFFLLWGFLFAVSLSFCCEVCLFALRLFPLPLVWFFLPWGFSFCCEVTVILLPWQLWATVQRRGKQQAIG